MVYCTYTEAQVTQGSSRYFTFSSQHSSLSSGFSFHFQYCCYCYCCFHSFCLTHYRHYYCHCHCLRWTRPGHASIDRKQLRVLKSQHW